MKIRHISIQNFRGIKQLDWKISGDFICFIGPGDSTKSTILDAIEYVLSPRYNILFEDTDFYNIDVNQNIRIDITIGQLPNELFSEYKYGLCLRGWNLKNGINDEPEENDELVLTISLQVSKDLEPKWLIVNNRIQDEKRISAGDRAILKMSRLGVYTNRLLSWASGSILSTMTGEELKLSEILAEAARKIRAEIDLSSFSDIIRVANEAERLAKAIGVVPKDSIQAHFDIKRLVIKESGVALHDGNVPLRLSGIGTQRLMGLALQLDSIEKGGINLIDEIEYGLEPHRICQILCLLKKNVDKHGQIFLTTHSPCVLQELDVLNLKIVHSDKGVTTINDIKDNPKNDFQKIVRKNPSAFLAKRMIICEGKTEEGILRGIDNGWQQENKLGIWTYGVVSVCGGGDASFEIAKQFNTLKYQVLWWGDSDLESSKTKKEELKNLGIPVVDWSDASNSEQRLFLDLPWDAVKELIGLAIHIHDNQSIVDQIKSFFAGISENIEDWIDSQNLRDALTKASNEKSENKKGWFKNITYGEKAGEIVSKYLNKIDDKDLGKKIKIIRKWIETSEYSETFTSGK